MPAWGKSSRPSPEHGESLKDLVNRALAHELGLPSGATRKTGRVTLPLIARDAVPAVLVTNDDIATALEADAVWRAISARDDKSHKLWTDDYLAAFAQAGGLTLATLDRKLPGRYPSVRVEPLLS